MNGFLDGFVNMYNGVAGAISSLTFWGTLNVLMWSIATALGGYMLYDMGKTDGSNSESALTSSREGEIEAVTEKHKF